MSFSSTEPALFSTDVTQLVAYQQVALRQVDAGVDVNQVLRDFARACESLAYDDVHLFFACEGGDRGAVTYVGVPSFLADFVGEIGIGPSSQLIAPQWLGWMREPRHILDIEPEPLGRGWQSAVLAHGLRALWSWPIRAESDRFVGALACYLMHPSAPGTADKNALAIIAQTAALVLERKTSSRSVTAAHNRHKLIFDSATDFAIISVDLNGRVMDWSIGAERMLGWTASEANGAWLHRTYTPEDVETGIPEIEMRVALVDGSFNDERWRVRKSGERFWASGRITPLNSSAGDAVGFVKILRDRTEQRVDEISREVRSAVLEAQVVERTRKLDRIWQNSLDLLLELRADGVINAINPACTVALGYEESELLGHYFKPFVHPNDVEATVAALANATASVGALDRLEIRLRHRDGSYRWFAWRAASENGLLYANGRDITVERRQREQLLRASEARLQLALDAGGMGVWQWDLLSDKMIWLYGAARVHGLDLAEAPLHMPLTEYLVYVHPADHQTLTNTMTVAFHNAGNAQVEYRIIWPDGSVRWLDTRGYMLLDESGAPIHMVGVSTDITQRKRTEVSLRFLADASAELAGLVDPELTLQRLAFLAVPLFADWCTAYLLQDDGKLKRVAIAHIDPAKVQLAQEFHSQFSSDVDSSHGVWEVLRTGKTDFVHEVTPAMLAEHVRNPDQLAALKASGMRSYVIVPLRVNGKVLGAVSFIAAESGRLYDDNDVKLAEDLAHRAAIAIENAALYRTINNSDRAKSVFLATLSHELRNPLAAITNGLGLMRLVIDDKKRVVEAMKLVSRQTAQLTRLVDDLMDVSRITTGKIDLRKQPINLADVLRDAADTTRQEIEANQHTLSIIVPEQPAELVADPTRLVQVFSNLLTNAARYTSAGGRIDVMLEELTSEFVVRIRDTGAGIEPEMLSQIFRIFTQAVHPVQRNQGGLGIGLSLVEGLVKLHGGHVEAVSGGLGKGSEFIVRLPRVVSSSGDSERRLSVRNVPEIRPLIRRKILVVDDNEDAAVTLAQLLRTLDQEVEVAHDGLSAVDAVSAAVPDVVLMDIGLPGVDGYEAARRIREAPGSGRPVLIALTGWGEDSDKQQARDAGFDYHLLKPVEFDRLTEVLRMFEQRREGKPA